jgi:S1-C subfamily serine protease
VPNSLEGVVVAQIEPDSRADASGIKRGDVILRVNQTIVKNSGEFTQAVQNLGADQVLLWIWRESRTIFVVIPPTTPNE